jgi:hypothetical protein
MAALLFPGDCTDEAVGNIPGGVATREGSIPFTVLKLAGHSDVRLTTRTYARVQAKALRKAEGALDQIGPEPRRGGSPPPE